MLLLGVVSLMAGSTTAVPSSSRYGSYQSTTLPSNCTTTYATASYYTDAREYYTTKVPEYYTTF
jgi:hypothetical protein